MNQEITYFNHREGVFKVFESARYYFRKDKIRKL